MKAMIPIFMSGDQLMRMPKKIIGIESFEATAQAGVIVRVSTSGP